MTFCCQASSSSSRMMMNVGRTSIVRSTMRPRTFRPIAQRSLHSLPRLPGLLSNGKGCEPLFSADTLRLLWDDWHGGLLRKLNDEVSGTPWENSTIVETVIGTSQEPEHIQAFNFASLALNNSFFLSGLRAKQLPQGVSHWSHAPPPKPHRTLMDEIEKHFESLPAFKLAFSSAAYGMASSGYVWLVRDGNGALGIVPTFGAGTPLVQNRQQRQGVDIIGAESKEADKASSRSPAANASSSTSSARFPTSSGGGVQMRSFSSYSNLRSDDKRPGSRGEELFPLMCVSVHERDWLPDYGMWGKEEYLMRFWECVNWERVDQLNSSYTYKSEYSGSTR